MSPDDIRLSDLLARTIEEGDCLLWAGAVQDGQYPMWRIGDGKQHVVRRLIWTLAHEARPNGLQVGCNCGTPLCVHPDHLAARTRSKAQRGLPKSPLARIRVTLAKQAASKVLDMETARAIRASTDSCCDLDRQYGLVRGKSWRIKNNLTWREISSPFARLGAL